MSTMDCLAPNRVSMTTASFRYTEEIVHSVSAIDAAAWNKVRESNDIFMDLRLLAAIESSMQSTCRFRYLTYRDQNEVPVAIAVVCTFTIDVGVLADDDLSRWFLTQVRKLSPSLVNFRIVFCGLPLSACQSSLRIARGANSSAVLKLLDQTLGQAAKTDRASVIVLKEFADEELPAIKPLEQLGYRKADSLPTHYIHLDGGSFDRYTASLGSKKRQNIRRSMDRFRDAGLTFITTSDVPTIERLFTPATHQMYEAVLKKSKTQFEYLPMEFFLETARRLPDNCEFVFAMKDDHVVGFGIQLFTADMYIPMFVGLDYEINSNSDLYFNLLYRAITDGAGREVQLIEMGQNAEEVKYTKFCAVQSRRSIYVRGGSVMMDWIIKLFFKMVFPAKPLLEERLGKVASRAVKPKTEGGRKIDPHFPLPENRNEAA